MSASDSSNTASSNPTLDNVQGHAQYALGAAQSAIASVTGSDAWAHSADQNKDTGVQTIRSASSDAPGTTDDSLAAKACPVAGGGVGETPTSQ